MRVHVRVAVGGWVLGARRLTDWALRQLAAGEDVECLAQAPRGACVEVHGGAELAACEPLIRGENTESDEDEIRLLCTIVPQQEIGKSPSVRPFFAPESPA